MQPSPTCKFCKSDLAGATDYLCPVCGEPFANSADQRMPAKTGWFREFILTGILLVVLFCSVVAGCMAIWNIRLARTPFDYSNCKPFSIMIGCGPAWSAGLNFGLIQFPATVMGFIAGIIGFVFGRSRKAQLTCVVASSFLLLSAAVTGYYLSEAGP